MPRDPDHKCAPHTAVNADPRRDSHAPHLPPTRQQKLMAEPKAPNRMIVPCLCRKDRVPAVQSIRARSRNRRRDGSREFRLVGAFAPTGQRLSAQPCRLLCPNGVTSFSPALSAPLPQRGNVVQPSLVGSFTPTGQRRSAQPCRLLCPNGATSFSPGLRGTSYPGNMVQGILQPQRGCSAVAVF